MAVANFGLFLASICFVFAVKTTTPANAAFLGSLTPLVAVVFSRFLGERMTRSTTVALAVGLAGLTITVVGDLEAGSMMGNVSALVASVGFAIYTVCLRTDTEPRLVTSAAWLRPDDDHRLRVRHVGPGQARWYPPAADIAWALFHGAVIIVVGTVMFNAASKHVPAVPMTVFAQTEMVFVPIWGLIVLDLRPKPLTVVGRRDRLRGGGGQGVVRRGRGRRNDFTTAPDVPLL